MLSSNVFRRLHRVWVKFDSVKVHGSVTNGAGDADRLGASKRNEFDLEFLTHGEMGGGEQAHTHFADVDAEAFDTADSSENTQGGVQKLARLTASIRSENPAEKHREESDFRIVAEMVIA
jgi:hypothetical protein